MGEKSQIGADTCYPLFLSQNGKLHFWVRSRHRAFAVMMLGQRRGRRPSIITAKGQRLEIRVASWTRPKGAIFICGMLPWWLGHALRSPWLINFGQARNMDPDWYPPEEHQSMTDVLALISAEGFTMCAQLARSGHRNLKRWSKEPRLFRWRCI